MYEWSEKKRKNHGNIFLIWTKLNAKAFTVLPRANDNKQLKKFSRTPKVIKITFLLNLSKKLHNVSSTKENDIKSSEALKNKQPLLEMKYNMKQFQFSFFFRFSFTNKKNPNWKFIFCAPTKTETKKIFAKSEDK